MNIQRCENQEKLCSNNVSDNVELQMTMSMKTENVSSTPNKAADLQNDYYNDKMKNFNSPLNNTFNERELQELLKSPFKSPKINNNREKFLQSSNITPMSKVGSQKKRKINVHDDNDIFNSELYNTEYFNDFEGIDMLHDLNFVAHFENTKASDILLNTMIDANTNAQENDENLMEVNKDPLKDPLSISDREERDSDTTLTKSKSRYPVRKRRSIRLYHKQINRNNSFKKHKNKLNTKEKYLLEELENIKEQEELSLNAIKKLLLLQIKLIHKVPPQHKIELTGAHAPTKEQKRLFQKHGPLRKGPYSPAEDKIIRKNWNTFCNRHDWDPKKVEPFFNWKHNGKFYIDNVEERQKFVQFLSNGLPWRTLYSVYSRFKILYHNKITYTRYTSEEDEKILMYIQNKHLNARNAKYVELAKLLKRTSKSIAKRYHYLKKTIDKSKTKPLVNVKWTLPLTKKFIKNLLSVTLSENIEELKYATLPKPVWQKLEEKLNIHETVLKTFWQHQLHLQLFSTDPIYLNDIKIRLIEYMYGKGISNTREIIWPNVAQHFEGTTAAFLCKAFFYLVQDCDMNNVDNFTDVIEYLYRTKIPEIQNAPTDKFLPRIVYEKGRIYILNEDDNPIITDSDDLTNSDDFDTDDN